jgi:hypothetical protein
VRGQGERIGAVALQGVRFRPADVSRPLQPDATLFAAFWTITSGPSIHFGYSS